jgi:hypothetical protein
MYDVLTTWLPSLLLLALFAGAAWGAVGVSAGSPGWGSIQGFLGTFLLGGAVASYLPLRGLREVLELAGVAGREFWELDPALRPGVDLIWAGMDQAVQLALLGAAMQASFWPRRAGLRTAVALGLGSVFCRTVVELHAHGADAVPPLESVTRALGASAAAFLLGSLFGAGQKLAGWVAATLALALVTWASQTLSPGLGPLAGLLVLFSADRLLWIWRVGESESVERLYPLWRAAYEVHRQCSGGRRLLRLWRHISFREKTFRAMGVWLPALVVLSVLAGLPLLPVVLAGGSSSSSWALVAGFLGYVFLSIGGIGLAWAAAGEHASRFPQWAFLAGLDRPRSQEGPDWRQQQLTYLCVVLAGLACGFTALA